MTTTRQVLALGGGGFSDEPENPLLDDFLLGLARRERPRICFLGTASGDADSYLLKFLASFASRDCVASHLGLFRREVADLRSHVLAQDILFVGGGNTANLLALWRLHGLDVVLRDAYDAGVVLAGVSAGALCWFEAAITDSFGGGLQAMHDGLGLLPGSACPHYDGEPERRPTYMRVVADGFPGGYAIDDGAALHVVDGELREVVSSRPGASAYRVELVDGSVREAKLPTRYLGD